MNRFEVSANKKNKAFVVDTEADQETSDRYICMCIGRNASKKALKLAEVLNHVNRLRDNFAHISNDDLAHCMGELSVIDL